MLHVQVCEIVQEIEVWLSDLDVIYALLQDSGLGHLVALALL